MSLGQSHLLRCLMDVSTKGHQSFHCHSWASGPRNMPTMVTLWAMSFIGWIITLSTRWGWDGACKVAKAGLFFWWATRMAWICSNYWWSEAMSLWMTYTRDSTTVERYVSGNEIMYYEVMLMEWMDTNRTKRNNTLICILHWYGSSKLLPLSKRRQEENKILTTG